MSVRVRNRERGQENESEQAAEEEKVSTCRVHAPMSPPKKTQKQFIHPIKKTRTKKGEERE